jgi:hypothetical protein
MHEINSCEVCGNKQLETVLDLGKHPMCDDLVEVGSERICKEYPIEIVYCDRCNTAHQKYQVPKHDLFPSTYHYRSRFTADVLNGMRELVKGCEDRFGSLQGKKVVDIGCNDGSLLDFFREKGAVTIGIEPTGACADAAAKGHSTYNDYLSEEVAQQVLREHGKADFITFTNVFAHIENLHEVFASLRILMSETTVIVIENHYLGAVLDKNQFDTFYHEHPRTYSFDSFKHMARSLGLDIVQVVFPARYGGNIRVSMGSEAIYGNSKDIDLSQLAEKEAQFKSRFSKMSSDIRRWETEMKQKISELTKENGPLKAKAFPGRAAILIKLLDLTTNEIAEVYEKPGSLKIGYYLPGTRIPIKSDDELFSGNQSDPILNLAWHIPVEIENYLRQNNYTGTITNILSQEQFN